MTITGSSYCAFGLVDFTMETNAWGSWDVTFTPACEGNEFREVKMRLDLGCDAKQGLYVYLAERMGGMSTYFKPVSVCGCPQGERTEGAFGNVAILALQNVGLHA